MGWVNIRVNILEKKFWVNILKCLNFLIVLWYMH